MAVLDELISSVRCLVNPISALGPECAAVDQIDQVLCLGGAVDRPGYGCTGGGNAMDAQRCTKSEGPF
jgi:hypothetical protein